MIALDAHTFGYALTAGYSEGRAASQRRVQALQGRPRYRLHDTLPSYLFNVTYDFDESQFSAFEAAWSAGPAQGRPFSIHLKITSHLNLEDRVPALAISPYTATRSEWNRWQVAFRVEVPGGTAITGTICDVYWAGSVAAPAADDINANPIDALPDDVIDPCPGVFHVSP